MSVKKIDEFNAEDRIDIKLLENSVFFLTGKLMTHTAGILRKIPFSFGTRCHN